MLIRLRDLQQDWIGAHVLDIGLNERRTFFNDLDNFLLTDDCPVDQRSLGRSKLPSRHRVVLWGLLLSEDGCSGRAGEGCRQEASGEQCTGGVSCTEVHDLRLP